MHRICVLLVLPACALTGQTLAEGAPGAPGYSAWQDRWDHYLDRTYSWKRIGGVAAQGAISQVFSFGKCDRAPFCLPDDIGRSLARRTARTTVELGAGALLGEDIRSRPSGLPGFRRRIGFAVTHAWLATGRNGEWRPAYSRFAGTIADVTVSSAWSGKPLTARHLAASTGWSVTNYLSDAMFAELKPDLKRYGVRVWKAVLRKPR